MFIVVLVPCARNFHLHIVCTQVYKASKLSTKIEQNVWDNSAMDSKLIQGV